MSHDPLADARFEIAQLRRLLDENSGLIADCLSRAPTRIEVLAMGTVLHAYYNGVENLLKRMSADGPIPLIDRSDSHRELLKRASTDRDGNRAIIDSALFAALLPFLQFRHLYRHAYAFNLEWPKMRQLAADAGATLDSLEQQALAYLERARPADPPPSP